MIKMSRSVLGETTLAGPTASKCKLFRLISLRKKSLLPSTEDIVSSRIQALVTSQLIITILKFIIACFKISFFFFYKKKQLLYVLSNFKITY
ncbi:hypothetical protein EDC94DRAFT_651932 [Helicostylum pulchrum]|nr:hypothetical protein EDC94DRAFT_651932 [Helicostylum pulchrum]